MSPDNPTNNKNFPFKLSFKDKMANDYELAKTLAEYYNSYQEESKHEKYIENFELHRGSWSQIENKSPTSNLFFEGENVILGGGKLRHIPQINQVSQAVVGEMIMNPMIPTIRDTSPRAVNHRERVRSERTRQYFIDRFVTPQVNLLRNQFLTTQANLAPEQMKEADTNIQKQVMDSLPEEIADGVSAYKMPDEILSERIMERIFLDEDIKEKVDTGADYAVVVAEEYYRTGIRNNKPFVEVINGRDLTWGGSSRTEWVQDAEFAKYTRYLSFQELVADFGTKIKWKDIDDISKLYSAMPTAKENLHVPTQQDRDITDIIANNPQFNDPNSQAYINPVTKDGQLKMLSLYNMLGSMRDKNYGVKHTYITWRWTRKVRAVTRMVNGKRVEFIEDEHYVKNIQAGDLEVKWTLIEQVWECDIINDEYYLNIGPCRYQYNHIGDYTKPPLPIIGLKYNTFHGNAKNASLVDLGKPAQFKLNLVHKKLEEYEATDFGTLLGIMPSLKPDNQTWTQFFTSAFRNKVFLMNRKFEGATNNDRSPFERIDMSRQQDIEGTIRKAEYYENQVIKQMLYNPVKFGQISQYQTNQNAALSVQGADRQMVRFLNKRRLLKQKLLTQVLNLGIIAFRDNEYLKDLMFDDLTRAYYDLNVEPFSASSLGLFVVDDFEDLENVKQMKSYGLAFLQNGGSPRDIADIIAAKSMSEMKDILEKAGKRIEKNMQEQRAHESEIAQMQQKAQDNALQMKYAFDQNENERDRQTKLQMSAITSDLLKKGSDVDENKVNDSLQKTILEIASKERMHSQDLQIEKLKIAAS